MLTKLKHRGADDQFTEPEFQRLLQALVETHPQHQRVLGQSCPQGGHKGRTGVFPARIPERRLLQRTVQAKAGSREKCRWTRGWKSARQWFGGWRCE